MDFLISDFTEYKSTSDCPGRGAPEKAFELGILRSLREILFCQPGMVDISSFQTYWLLVPVKARLLARGQILVISKSQGQQNIGYQVPALAKYQL